MKRGLFYVLIMCLCISSSIFYFGQQSTAQEEVISIEKEYPAEQQERRSLLDGFLPVHVDNYEVTIAYEETKAYQQATEHIQGWRVHRAGQEYGFLSMHQYKLATGGHYYFLRYLPKLAAAEDVQLSLPLTFSSYKYRTILYPHGLDYTKSVWSQPVSAKVGDSLPTSALYVDDHLLGSYFFSYIDVFKRQANAVKQEEYQLARPIQITTQGVQLRFPQLNEGIIEQWGIISAESLVDWTNQTALADLRIADLNRVRKWSQEGTYYQTPTTYSPTSATSFYMNPAHHIGEKFLRSTGARMFEDVALLSLYTATRTQNEQGYWYTTPQSNWLYNDYGIPNTFYDTRFSTDAALFLLKGYQRFGEPLFLQAAKKYGDFFVTFAEQHHFKTDNGGYLVWDYGHDFLPQNSTHVSLNHLVTEMNFLYELYQQTKELTYLKTAHKIKLAVQDTASKWKKETDGDLWYAYLKDGHYGLKDYPLLTLKDLRYSKQLIKEVDGEIEPAFVYLIQVKEAYLKKTNQPLN